MLDDDARRSLEEEAIALVSLSRPPRQHPHAHQHQPLHSHLRPLLHDKASRTTTSHSSSNSDAHDSERNSAVVGVVRQPEVELVYAQQPVELPPPQPQQQDSGGISMKSLLVTLKKRKLPSDDATTAATESERLAKVLPSFRDVFEPPPLPSADERASPTRQPLPGPQQAVDATANVAANAEGELKCKYRTGKCSNVRALKSCGDYHNLCNYHRLRANANQRKLDRKKKVQRLQVDPTASASASVSPSVSAATVSKIELTIAAAASSMASSVAAVLVAMPSSAPPVGTRADRKTNAVAHSSPE